jgi:hypothetical protein
MQLPLIIHDQLEVVCHRFSNSILIINISIGNEMVKPDFQRDLRCHSPGMDNQSHHNSYFSLQSAEIVTGTQYLSQ